MAAATAEGDSKFSLGLFDDRWRGCCDCRSVELVPSWDSEVAVEAADVAEIELPEDRLDAEM